MNTGIDITYIVNDTYECGWGFQHFRSCANVLQGLAQLFLMLIKDPWFEPQQGVRVSDPVVYLLSGSFPVADRLEMRASF